MDLWHLPRQSVLYLKIPLLWHAAGNPDLNSPFAQTSATALAQAAASNNGAVAQSLAQAAAREPPLICFCAPMSMPHHRETVCAIPCGADLF